MPRRSKRLVPVPYRRPTYREALEMLEESRELSPPEARQVRNLLWKGGHVPNNSQMGALMEKLALVTWPSPSIRLH